MQIAAEEIRHRRETGHGLGTAFHPTALCVLKRLVGHLLLDGEQPDHRIAGLGDLLLGVGRLLYRPRHVGLAGADPHVPEHHIAQRDGILPGDSHLQRTAVFGALQPNDPLPFGVRGGGYLSTAQRECHTLPRVSDAPDRRLGAALEHHVVAEQRGQMHVGPDRRADAHPD